MPRAAIAPIVTSRILALDGLRGLAILMVMCFHFHVATCGNGWLGHLLDNLAGMGCSGVNLFFVLSGFLITGILWEAKKDPHYFRNFYARRLLRIFPLYYGVLFVGLILIPWLHPALDLKYANTVRHQMWLWTYTSNFYECLSGRPMPLFGHFWTLAVEEHFYFVWPFLVFWLTKRALMATCVVCWFFAVATRLTLLRAGADPALAVLRLDPCQLDSLATGAFLALALQSSTPGEAGWTPPRRLLALSAAMVASLFWAFSVWLDGHQILVAISGSCWSVFFGAGLAYAVVSSPGRWLRQSLEMPVLRTLGKYSYGLYVFHWPLGRLCLQVLEKWRREHPGSALDQAIMFQADYFLLAVSLSCLLAWVSWHFYEKPFLRLKSYFEYKQKVTGYIRNAQPTLRSK